MIGRITWFDSARGYGFIEPRDGGDDIFFAIEGATFELRPGAMVDFVVIDGPRGPEAIELHESKTVNN